jgi:hypothetical protein
VSWFETLLIAPVKALNEVKSNVWSVALVITGITLLLHGHETAGNSLITGAFAVFRSSTETHQDSDPKTGKE